MAPGPVEPEDAQASGARESRRRIGDHADRVADGSVDDDADRSLALEEIAEALADDAHVLVAAGADHDHVARPGLIDRLLDVERVARPGQDRESRAENPHVVLERLDLVVHRAVAGHRIDELGGVVLVRTA